MIRHCPSCGSIDQTELIGKFPVTSAEKFSREQWDLVVCPCSMIYLSPLPTTQDFEVMYSRGKQFDSPEYSDPIKVSAIVEFMTGRLQYLISSHSLNIESLRVLEVGAGYAWMCRAAKEMDSRVLTVAQDVTTEVSDKCPWVDFYKVGDLDFTLMQDIGTFEIISITHVLEHISNPVPFLTKLAQLLSPAGVIFITMPHKPVNQHGGRDAWLEYSYHHVPAHLNYYSKDALSRTASLSGLRLIYWDATSEGGAALEAHLCLDANQSLEDQ